MPLSQGKVAFVTGVNGISGNAIVEHLIRQPKTEWSRIVVTSRSPLKNYWEDPRVEFVAIDFLAPLDDILARMTPFCEGVTHTYFTSYIHTDDFDKLKDYNEPLFQNFLTAIDTVAGRNLERVCLQTGAKHYGCHLGRIPVPMSEEHGRYDDKGLNFYYQQEDFMFELHKKRQWKWNVIRPSGIVGFTPAGNSNSQAMSFALYFLICRELGETPMFPGNKHSYNVIDNVSYAPGIADMAIWATTNNHTANEAFNHVNGDIFCFRYLFPKLGEYFGVKVDEPKFNALGESAHVENEYKMHEWAKDKKQVWERICREYGGNPKAIEWGTWGSMDWGAGKSWPASVSITKARKYGWTRYDDTPECWVETFRAMENAGIIPQRHILRQKSAPAQNGHLTK